MEILQRSGISEAHPAWHPWGARGSQDDVEHQHMAKKLLLLTCDLAPAILPQGLKCPGRVFMEKVCLILALGESQQQ